MKAFDSDILGFEKNLCGECPNCKCLVQINDGKCLNCDYALTEKDIKRVSEHERINYKKASVIGLISSILFLGIVTGIYVYMTDGF